MGDGPARLLTLLSLLQRRPQWSGPDLARRMGVATRTVRRDVDRLRGLGYPVDALPGPAGGYRLATGAEVPPLLLDDEEAVAVTVALSIAAAGAAGVVGEASLAALAKLDRLLPARLRPRVAALRRATVAMVPAGEPLDVLVALAQACDADERVVLTYEDREGRVSQRRVEPHHLVATGRRWYLLAWDLDRADWRTLRVDRVRGARRTGHRFVPGRVADPARVVGEAITTAPYRHQARVVVEAEPEELRRRVPPTVGVVVAHRRGCELQVGADDLARLAGHLVALDVAFEVLEPPELRDLLDALGRRLVVAHADHR